MPIAGTAGRLRRIEKRASPELKAAIEAGLVSRRKADQLLYLSPARQRAYFAARAGERERQSAHAGMIREYLDGLDGGKPDLEELRVILGRGR